MADASANSEASANHWQWSTIFWLWVFLAINFLNAMHAIILNDVSLLDAVSRVLIGNFVLAIINLDVLHAAVWILSQAIFFIVPVSYLAARNTINLRAILIFFLIGLVVSTTVSGPIIQFKGVWPYVKEISGTLKYILQLEIDSVTSLAFWVMEAVILGVTIGLWMVMKPKRSK